MKTAFFAALALALASLWAAGFAPVQAQPAAATTAAARTLTVSGRGEVQAAPDMVTLSAGVTSEAPTAAAALAANSSRMQAVFAALRKLGIADKDVQTANFSVSPQMTSGADNQPPRVTGYQVDNHVAIRLADIDKLGAALDALVAAGANQMNGIDFAIRDPAALLAQARAAAVIDARTKAETYAKAAGVSLGAILSIGETGDEVPRPQYKAMMMSAARSPVPVAAGEESVGADVSIVWEIH